MMTEGFVHGVLNSDNLLVSVSTHNLNSTSTDLLESSDWLTKALRGIHSDNCAFHLADSIRARYLIMAHLDFSQCTIRTTFRRISMQTVNTLLAGKWMLAAGTCSALEQHCLCCLVSFESHGQQHLQEPIMRGQVAAKSSSTFHRWRKYWCVLADCPQCLSVHVDDVPGVQPVASSAYVLKHSFRTARRYTPLTVHDGSHAGL